MSRFGKRIKSIRKKHRLTLEKVAGKVGTHKGYISGIENGKVNPPSVKLIKKIARALGADTKEMIKLAYIDKLPKIIRKDFETILLNNISPNEGKETLLTAITPQENEDPS